MSEMKFVGKPVVRIDGLDKVSASAEFADDLEFGPGLLHAEIILSTEPHAMIKNIYTKDAEKVEDVVKVFTGRDFPFKFGLYMQDRFVFAQDRVRFVGEQVAAVVARTPYAAKKAAGLVRIEYEPLSSILCQLDALKDGALLIHPDLHEYPHVPWFFPKKGTNIAHHRKVRKGDVEQGFREADLIVEDEYFVPRYVHCSIEPHVATAKFDHSSRLTVWSSSQSPHTQRHLFAAALSSMGLSHKDVRVLAPHVGGGFGGKAGVTMEIIPAVLATRLKGYPVKVRWSRENEFANTYQRLGTVARIKMGLRKDGTITAFDHKIYWDAGAYVEYGANVVNAAGLSATGPYRMNNVSIDSICVYTNLPPGGAYRGFGYSEILFGIESHMNQAARRLGMDPLKLRRINAITDSDTLAYGVRMNPNGLKEAIDRVSSEIGWD
ncbi:MAG: molybdopterin-dependent oxidoreductase, partial [Oligoflexales bacterium]|nr:molybdopterin-dependent oxidoreductase [Oligoflexales bacterium]